ncbi:CoA transferase [soil metagenome]
MNSPGTALFTHAGSDAPLAGLRVLDLSRVLAGPLCTMTLADLGADVIKVERPGSGDETRQWGPPWAGKGENRESAYYLCANRNKRSVTADLGAGTGRTLVLNLARGADVLVENFAPGTMDRWGIGYEDLARENPGLVFCSISGYGVDGPEAGRPGYDFAVQARSGWMAVTGEAEGPPMKAGVAVVDVLTGQNAVIGILAALRERERSGSGQRVEIALFDSAVAGLVNVTQAALVGSEPARHGNAHPTIVPYQAFDTADGTLVIAVGNDAQWRRFCAAIGSDSLAADARFETNPLRVQNRAELTRLLAATLKERSASDWLDRLESADVPCAPVRTIGEAIEDPVLRARNGVWTMPGPGGPVQTVASPIRLSRTPAELNRGAPALGEHQDEVSLHGW